MTRGARRIGFALSAIVHVAAAALLVLPGTTPVESTPQRVVPIDLEMFAPVVRRAAGQHDPAATIAHAAPPQPVRRVTRATVVEPVAEPAVDSRLPVATESPDPRAVATANPVRSPSPVVTPTPRRAAERPHPHEHAVERAPPAALPIDHAAQQPAPRQRPRVARA
ncbi:MAG: hypothetical protein QNJ91_14590, partial [Gammaproteobacteria bacterium]|nr:hypothetical protein [Gammaproteobacteria bacterium]